MFTIEFVKTEHWSAWCVFFDGIHICRGINKAVALETVMLMQASRASHY